MNCKGETFTATRVPSGHREASRQAVRKTHSPIAPINPAFSATGMNDAGEIGPRVG